LDFWGLIPSHIYKNCTSILLKNSGILQSLSGLPSEHRSSVGISCGQATDALESNIHKNNQGNRLKEDSIEAEIARSEQLFQQGDLDGAKACLIQVLAKEPQNPKIHNNLGVVYSALGQLEECHKHYLHAVEMAPEDLTYKKNLADFLLVGLKNPREALSLYNDVLARDSGDTEAQLGVGLACEASGKSEDARFFYENVLALEPENKIARKRLDQFPDTSSRQILFGH
jgi:tetratricopeptide (TPR) repeat protein